ncbi:MAG: M48 family metallopeptidase [Bacteroidales bacterium]|nr:M48 family metallopeptidase [Bacteroidales bacterium]
MKPLLLTLALVAFNFSVAQTLRSRGPVPADLKQSVYQLYQTDKQRAEQYAGRRVRNRQQLLEASYHINKMLASGHIIYGDPVSTLAARIADTLLRDYPDLRAELRFYTVTAPQANAFTTPQGIIFINAGLVAQVENEAQLAFVIAHEIIHYYRAHGLETLLRKRERREGRDLDDEAEQTARLLRYHARSREMESEADSLGIALFYLPSPYWKEVSESVFDILQYGELPFDDIPFDTTLFNTPYYALRGCWLDSVAPITISDDDDDTYSSHPNILTRRRHTAQALSGHTGGQKFLVTTPEQFYSLRHTVRLECIRYDLLHGHFARALYNSWLLLRTNPDDETLNLYFARALYSAAVARCNDNADIMADNYLKTQGESQQVCYALKTAGVEQLTLAALHNAWSAHLRFPANDRFPAMAHHLMQLLRHPLGKSSPDFLSTPPDAAALSTPQPDTAARKGLTKYERIRLKRQNQSRQTPTAYALTDLLMADTSLLAALHLHLDGPLPEEPKALQPDTHAMLLFNPNYWVMDHGDNLVTSRSITHEEDLCRRIATTVARLGGHTVDFSDQGMHAMLSDTQYNDFLTVCEWMNEFWLTKGRYPHLRLTQPAMDSLLDRYGATTLTMTAVLNNEGQSGSLSPSYALLVPLAPMVIAAALTGLERTTMVSLVADARRGTMLTRQAYTYKMADHPALIDAMLHDTYSRVLRPARRDPVGFMGHRFALAAGVNMGLSGKQPFKQGHYVAFTPWASAEFALKRSLSIAATARYQAAYPDVTVAYLVPRQVGNSISIFDSIDVSSRNMLTLGLEVRIYKNSHFAPLGYYFDIGAHAVHFSLPGGGDGGNTYGIHFGIGRNYIFHRHLLLNYQIDYAYTYGLSKTFGFETDTRQFLHYPDAVLSNILTLKLGIGIVP